MPNPNGFITVAQFLYYNDTNRVCELLSDDEDGAPVLTAALENNTTLLEIINAATQEISSACEVGKRYTMDELLNLANDKYGATVTLSSGDYSLTGGTTVNGLGAKLRELCADLGWCTLVKRRRFSAQKFAQMAPGYEEALQKLELLRLGERIFSSVSGTPEAGLPAVEVLGVDAAGTILSKTGLWGNIAVRNQGYLEGAPREY